MTDLTPILSAIITLLGAVVTVFVIPLLRKKLTAEKRAELMTYVTIAVKAAEQLAKAGIIKPEERKASVVKFLNDLGFTVDMEELEAMINSIVVDLPPLIIKTKKLPE